MSPLSPRLASATSRAGVVLGVLAALLSGLLLVVRPWYLHWGATPQELAGPLPGDAHAVGPIHTTRAIDIRAPATQVFAWVAQLGQDRAGFYSYELLEDLAGCQMPDVRRLDPALQHWSVGQKLWMYPRDELDGMGHATLLELQPERLLVFGTHTPLDPPGSLYTGTWSFIVEPTSDATARLIVRGSGGGSPSLLGTAFTRTVFEPVHFAMERRMLEGIRGLAEGRPLSKAADAVQIGAWLASFGMFVAAGVLAVLGARFQRRLLAFAAGGLVFQILTLVQPWPAASVAATLLLGLLLMPPSSRRRASAEAVAEQLSRT
jgi:hypothetical protein